MKKRRRHIVPALVAVLTVGAVVTVFTVLVACSSGVTTTPGGDGSATTPGGDGGATTFPGPATGGTPADCPGIAGRFGGPQAEGSVICEHNSPAVLICKGGQWVSAGVSCADS